MNYAIDIDILQHLTAFSYGSKCSADVRSLLRRLMNASIVDHQVALFILNPSVMTPDRKFVNVCNLVFCVVFARS
jgi:hypothetical protein